ncbi:DMT family transporter [Niallia circulans]|uniref:DMT family transporter n=1 Tax=Niallia circulans TaxID=1397 RepID=A0A553SQ43_NIACI|nr:DMT family transporter [Niallia circulans]
MSKNKQANILLLAVALIWGSTFVLVQNAISFLEPLLFNGVRFFIAFLFLLLWLLLFHRHLLKELNTSTFAAGVVLGFCLFIGYAFQTIGLLYTSSSKAGFITGLSVVLVPLFLLLFFKHKLSVNSTIGIAFATAGLYAITIGSSLSLNVGDGFVLICAVGFAMQIVLTGTYSSKHSALLLTIVQIFTVSALSFIGSLSFEDWSKLNISSFAKSDVLLALFVTSIFATALAFVIQTSLQKYTNASTVALIFATEPVFASATAYIFAGERLTVSAFIGCFLILFGMIVTELPMQKFMPVLKQKSG